MTNTEHPKVSIIIATYNRAHKIRRSIDSLLNQTFQDFEIIVVNDGSTDNTLDVLEDYKDRIRLFDLPKNKGVCGAKNVGLDNIKGEWFGFLDDDDELVPLTLETMLNIPKEIDPEINAVTCNCMDSVTKQFSGKGLSHSQYLTLEKNVKYCSGEFWGIQKTSLLGDKRFDESMPGIGNGVWYRIDEIAKRYYLHEALRIYYTDGNDHVTTSIKSLDKAITYYQGLLRDDFYLEALRKYDPVSFKKYCLKGVYLLEMGNDKEGAEKYRKKLAGSDFSYSLKEKMLLKLPTLVGGGQLRGLFTFARKSGLNKIFSTQKN